MTKATLEELLDGLTPQQRINSLTRRLAHAQRNGTKTQVKLLQAALNRAKAAVAA